MHWPRRSVISKSHDMQNMNMRKRRNWLMLLWPRRERRQPKHWPRKRQPMPRHRKQSLRRKKMNLKRKKKKKTLTGELVEYRVPKQNLISKLKVRTKKIETLEVQSMSLLKIQEK